ncbi:MAG: SCO family protein [Bacteroidia bacterium]|nr:SCO family protein [Bacteroidia bacterium]
MKQRITTGIVALLILGVALTACKSEEKKADQAELLVYNQDPLPDFKFMNQDSQWVTQQEVMGKIHVMDFFFTSCPTICPVMKANMLTIYEKYATDDRVILVSHSIDTRHDSVPVLKAYAERMGVTAPRWNFVTGDKDKIMGMAKSYMVTAMEDSTEAGGYAHSGAMILFDRDHNIRGFFDGTSEEETKELSVAMDRLLNE